MDERHVFSFLFCGPESQDHRLRCEVFGLSYSMTLWRSDPRLHSDLFVPGILQRPRGNATMQEYITYVSLIILQCFPNAIPPQSSP